MNQQVILTTYFGIGDMIFVTVSELVEVFLVVIHDVLDRRFHIQMVCHAYQESED